jgi:hypothetical protein
MGAHTKPAAQPPPACVSEHVSPWLAVTAGLFATADTPLQVPATVVAPVAAPFHQLACARLSPGFDRHPPCVSGSPEVIAPLQLSVLNSAHSHVPRQVAAFVLKQLQPHESGPAVTPLMTWSCAPEKLVGHAGRALGS